MLRSTLSRTLAASLRAAPAHPLGAGVRFASTQQQAAQVPGQVDLPDMAQIEREVEVRASIPSAPDTYLSRTSSTSADFNPSSPPDGAQEGAVHTASHPSTHGEISHGSKSGDDVQPGEAGDSTSSIPSNAHRNAGSEGGSGEGGSRPLNEEEKKGLLKIAGIFAAGWGLSVVTDPRWRRGETAKD
ncbi:hypothetical protein JCM10213_006682 [Rhodosporidiobolus nylandii]